MSVLAEFAEGTAPLAPAKPRVAVFKMASCDGCQLQLLDAEEALLELAGAIEIVNFAEATSRDEPGPYDVTLVEGSVSTSEQIEQLRAIRAASSFLITIGACATSGGVQALRNGTTWASRSATSTRRPCSSTRSPTPRRSPITSRWTWSSRAARSIAASCSRRSRGCCRARCRGRRRRRSASSASGAVTSAWSWRRESRAWDRSRAPAAARSALGWAGAATAASVRRSRRTPRPSRRRFIELGMSPSLVAEKFRFITGYAPAFREVADRLEREAAT